jgi:phosphatidylinositol alpha-1,6-mannosyltransferase
MPDKHPVIITLDYPPERGGIARYLGELVNASGKDVEVVVPAAHGIEGPGNIMPKEMFRSMWPRWWPIVGVCKRAKDRASKIIVSHILPVGTAAMISRWFGGPPFILICHGLDVRLAAETFFRRHLFLFICWTADCVVANSKSTAKFIQKITGTRAKIITPAVNDMTFLDKKEARVRLGIPEDDHVILCVGRLIERKGAATAIEAVKQLPTSERIQLVIIGDGPELHRIRELAMGSHHRIRIITNASDEHVREWYAAANVFCLPVKEMTDDVEGFGIVFLEAALAGLPCIAGKTGGAVEAVVDRETGILVDPFDAREVAQALTLLLGDPEKQKEMGNNGRTRVLKDFRWVDRWEEFSKIIERDKSKSYES